MTKSEKKLEYWDYSFKPPIDKKYQLDLSQGNTPLLQDILTSQQIPEIPSDEKIFLKREDLNPNGSFKDRALAYQVSYLKQQNQKYCVISSSGNAAISTAAFCKKAGIKAIILISPNIPNNKLSQITKHNPFLLIKSARAS
ncbi:PLP-dependent lyase/thiolase, partial [Patescibacteria group bacterium]|nr:PLP-dependent lyase/thiolase [Patescibacteria group bacterium]